MNDLISRQAATAEFKPYARYDSNRTNAEWVRRIELVLKELPNKGCKYWDSESNFCALQRPADHAMYGKWISCKEKLPIPNEDIDHVWKYYLVQNEYTDMMIATYRENTKGERYWEQMYHYRPVEDEIVAWMELPEKYLEN